ncbi:MAG: hypothetical protein ACW99A_02835 [Candidatus Kariarchaeaceae archaeon]|jgi:uncharacterized protein YacL
MNKYWKTFLTNLLFGTIVILFLNFLFFLVIRDLEVAIDIFTKNLFFFYVLYPLLFFIFFRYQRKRDEMWELLMKRINEIKREEES